MDLFTKLFGDFLVFVYHCFDRIVIRGYLTALSRPELVVHFFRDIVGVAEVSKEALSQRTADYQNWVEAYARNHAIPIEWAEKGVRKEDHVLPWLRRMEKRNAYGVYFIFKSMEQGPTFRIRLPKYPTKDPHYRIVAHQRSRFTHYSICRVSTPSPRSSTAATSSSGAAFPSTSCSSAAANSACGGSALTRSLRSSASGSVAGCRKLATVIDQIEHGHHVFRAYFKSGFLKQYEKFLTFLRNELVSNNLTDFGLRKGLDHLDAVRTTFRAITDRFAGYPAEWLNVHVDFPLLQRLARPFNVGAVRYPGLKIHEPRIVRLFEVLLHGGPQVGGWTARQIHHAVLTSFALSEKAYGLNQLRYDLRKLKGMASSSATAHATPTASRKKASRWPCSSCSSTSACADPSPTAASITGRTRTPSRQPSRSRLSPRRCRHPTGRRLLAAA